MTNAGQMARLQKFACEDSERSISTVVVKCGIGYATDGRMIVREAMDEPCEDIVSREDGKPVPVDNMVKYSKYPDVAHKWYVFPKKEFEEFERNFRDAFRAKVVENDREYSERYKQVMCPCCNEDLYWDTYEEKLVSKREEKQPVQLSDISLPVRLVFPDDGFIVVNFGYIFRVAQEYENLMFAKSKVEDQKAELLFMKTSDGKMASVLMPLRTYDSDCVRGRVATLKEAGS